jgi:predicted ester cyclase
MDSTVASDPRSIAVRSILIMADGSPADFAEVIHPDAVNREAQAEPAACRVGGPEGFLATAHWLREAFADLHFDIHHAVADGDLVAVHATMSGRHVAPFVTYTPSGEVDTAFPATGRTFAFTQSHWLRIKDGRLIEHWANRDDLGQARQLGWVPPTPVYLLKMARAKAKAKRSTRVSGG